MVKQRNIGPDTMEQGGDDVSAAFLDALRTRAMDEMHLAALEYGIILKDLGALPLPSRCEVNLLLTTMSDTQPSSTGSSRVRSRRPWTSSRRVRYRRRSRPP